MTATVIPLLSPMQHRILSVIREFATEHGYPPTIREIASATHLALSSVSYQLVQLNAKGWISRHPSRARSIVVLDPDTGGA